MVRTRISRPSESSPKGCARLGGARMSRRFCVFWSGSGSRSTPPASNTASASQPSGSQNSSAPVTLRRAARAPAAAIRRLASGAARVMAQSRIDQMIQQVDHGIDQDEESRHQQDDALDDQDLL